MNCFGALGSSNSCGLPLKSLSAWISSSLEGFVAKFTNTAAVCPSRTGTLIHCEVIVMQSLFLITPSSTLPQSLSGSCSDFSSSPPINGIIFPTISGHSLNVLPAPEIAWYVVTTTSFGSNFFHAVRTGV